MNIWKKKMRLFFIIFCLVLGAQAQFPLNACTLLEPGMRLRMYTPLSDLKILSELEEYSSQTFWKLEYDTQGFIHSQIGTKDTSRWNPCPDGRCLPTSTTWFSSGQLYRKVQGDTLFWNDRPSDKELDFRAHFDNDTLWVWQRTWSATETNPWEYPRKIVWESPKLMWIEGQQKYLMGYLSHDTCFADSTDRHFTKARSIYTPEEKKFKRITDMTSGGSVTYEIGIPSTLTPLHKQKQIPTHTTLYRLNGHVQNTCSGAECWTLRTKSHP
jgi:hypothetical protein